MQCLLALLALALLAATAGPRRGSY